MAQLILDFDSTSRFWIHQFSEEKFGFHLWFWLHTIWVKGESWTEILIQLYSVNSSNVKSSGTSRSHQAKGQTSCMIWRQSTFKGILVTSALAGRKIARENFTSSADRRNRGKSWRKLLQWMDVEEESKWRLGDKIVSNPIKV